MATEQRQSLLKKEEKEPASCRERMKVALDEYFLVSKRGSTLSGEVRAGTTAFLATANNFIVNAQIMSSAGLSKNEVVVSSAFVSGVANIISGILSNQPVGLMTSVGPNVFLAFSLVGMGLCDVDGALAISLACGAILFVFSLTPILQMLLALIPLSVKYGLVMGTGLLTAFIGLKAIHVVVPDTIGSNIVALGKLTDSPDVVISLVLLILMSSMIHRGIRGAVLIGMLVGTVASWVVSGDWPTEFVQLSQPHIHRLDFEVLRKGDAWPQVFALLLMLLFSISGAVIGCGRMAGLLKEDGGVPGSTAVYVTCGFTTMLSAVLGSSPVFISMSAAAGIRDGGRTGIMSITIGVLCLLVAFFFSPLASTMPHCATAPVLILVGFGMLGEAKEVRWWNTQEALPAFLCAIFQPFTYSVSNGIYAGVGMSFILFITTGSFLEYLPKGVQDKLGMANKPELIDLPREPSLPVYRTPSRKLSRKFSEYEEGEPRLTWGKHGSLHVFNTIPSSETSFGKSLSQDGTLELAEDEEAAEDDEPASRSRTEPAGRVRKKPADQVHKEPRVRNILSSLQPRSNAVQILGSGASLLGYDKEEATKYMAYKLTEGGARNTEGHWAGGVPAAKSHAALRSLLTSVDANKAGSMEEYYAAELMAREAPMVAAQAMRDRQPPRNNSA